MLLWTKDAAALDGQHGAMARQGHMTTEDVVARFKDAKHSGSGWSARCPAHEDRCASLSISKAPDGKTLLHCHAGCDSEDVVHAAGLSLADLFADASSTSGTGKPSIAATYGYTDENGTLLYQAVRYVSSHGEKSFKQRRPNGSGGWTWALGDVRRVPYRLPEVLQAVQAGRIVFIVEGEKDADRLHALGFVATCNSGGAGKWTGGLSEHFHGARVAVLPDNDDAGRNHALDVAAKLHRIAAEVRLVELPDLPAKGDVSDWLSAGGTVEELKKLVQSAPLWTPENATESLRLDGSALDVTPAAALAERRTALPGLPLQPLGDLLAEPEEETEWVVEGMLPAGGLSLLVAKPKVGKSTLARTLALAVARGAQFLGLDTAQGGVIHLALEEKRTQLINQYRSLGGTKHDEIYIFADTAPRDAVRLLEDAVIRHQPKLVIVDTVQRLIRVNEGNDYAKVTAALEPILAMARTHGVHLMLLHHSGKGEREAIDAAIGSTAWAGSVDTITVMKRKEGLRTLVTVQRYGDDLPETIIVMDEIGGVSVGGTRQDHDVDSAAAAITTFLDAQPGATQQNIRDGVEGHRTQVVISALSKLREAGKVRHEGSGKRGDAYRFFLVPELHQEKPGSGEHGNHYTSCGNNGLRQPEILVPALGENNGNQYSANEREVVEL